MIDLAFTLTSVGLGVGLAMDAFSVSIADGISEPKMSTKKAIGIAGVFAFFQALMPLVGWILVHTLVQKFKAFEKFIPWIALALLCYIGGKMLYEGIRAKCECERVQRLTLATLLVQGIATSIDALSVGFTIAEYELLPAIICALIIATITFALCFTGVHIGERVGCKFSNKASIVGGVILILIGIEIFITGMI
ncbi:MAG: manganese efflux pump [Clostridia bacterium]|nr:manganese efflux pump [Clostridia bacterium]